VDPLLVAIAAAPDDDAPRLVYADRLLADGDPRGELIALQCAGRDATRLLAKHGKAWLAELGLDGADAIWARGFLDTVSLDVELARRAWPRLLAEPGLRAIELRGDPGPIADVIGAHGLPRALRRLSGEELSVARDGDRVDASLGEPRERVGCLLPVLDRLLDGARALALRMPPGRTDADPILDVIARHPTLRALAIEADPAITNAITWIATSRLGDALAALPALEELRLPMGETPVIPLVHGGIRSLAVRAVLLTSDGNEGFTARFTLACLGGLQLPQLARLAIDFQYEVGAFDRIESIDTLVGLAPPSLAELEIARCIAIEPLIAGLAGSRLARVLRVLDLGTCPLVESGAQALLDARLWLDRLVVSRGDVSDETWRRLAAAYPGLARSSKDRSS
jgi:uncharacterized protein (TIGR02996 family)